ncbi:hypothetical protein O181_001690 [Austropuccinia psidii MF-1]|uniref:Uncharacterized protein n=1 Tax=Austropuccinia psidii MF-1 TaxID=1389203 RepID=A0A9Q3BB11_9BASI|nr:hypothetical protein [Austropuccinia psidii MF-1]
MRRHHRKTKFSEPKASYLFNQKAKDKLSKKRQESARYDDFLTHKEIRYNIRSSDDSKQTPLPGGNYFNFDSKTSSHSL